MFRKEKDLSLYETFQLSTSAIEALLQNISRQIPNLSRAQILNIFSNEKKVFASKLASGTILYKIQKRVIVFDLLGTNDLFPSLYLLLKYPNCMSSFIVKSNLVSEHIIKGADLMSAGVVSIDGAFIFYLMLLLLL